MSILLVDDYEFGPNGALQPVYQAASAASVVYETAAGKFKDGVYGVQVNANDAFITYQIAPKDEIYLSVFLVPNGANTGKQIKWSKAGVELGSLRWDGSKMNIHVGTDATPEVVGVTTVPALGSGGALKNYQLRVKIAAAGGSIQFKLDDVLETNYDNQNTKPGADTTIDEISIGNQVILDNLWINDTLGLDNNSWPGIVRMYSDRPIADSSEPGHNQWAGSSPGTKANLVNGDTVDENVFVASETVGQIQGFSYPTPCVPVGSTIKAVSIIDLPYKVSAGKLIQGLTIGGIDFVSAPKELNTGIFAGSARAFHHELNPSTGNPFAVTDNPQSYLQHAPAIDLES